MSNPFSPPNDRIFYACQAVLTGDGGSGGTAYLEGVQAVGINRSLETRNLSDVGRMNQTWKTYGKTIYEITISRLIPNDGTTFLVSGGTTYETGHLFSTNTIGVNGSLKSWDIKLVYSSDSVSNVGDDATYSTQEFKYCLLSSIGYSIGIDGAITEDLVFQAQLYDQGTSAPALSLPLSGQTIRRQDLDINTTALNNYTATGCTFPLEVLEAFNIGNTKDAIPILGLQNITIGCDIEYVDLPDNGIWRGSDTESEVNKWKVPALPATVTASFSGIVRSQYFVSGSDQNHDVTDTYHTAGTYGDETKGINNYATDRPIKIVTDVLGGTNLFQWDLGAKNYLTSFDVTGGDTGGGNVEATLSFQNDCSDFFLYQGPTVSDYSATDIY